jgi:hypothetical protein
MMLTIKPLAFGRKGKNVRFRTLVSIIERSALSGDRHDNEHLHMDPGNEFRR